MAGRARPVGVLALQGSFANHEAVLARHGVPTRRVRDPRDLKGLAGLVLPGGESTAMLRLLDRFAMKEPLRETVRALGERGRPVLATCAGLILLARRVTTPEQASLGLLDVDVARNAYGRQLASGTYETPGEGTFPDARSQFIRAPRILRAGEGVRVLARRDGDPVAVEQGGLLATTFHPESDPRHPVILRFLDALREEPRALGGRGRAPRR